MAKLTPANSGKSAKRKMPVGKRFQPGQSGNPSGRPKNEISIAHWLKEFGAMTSEQLAQVCEQYAPEFRKMKTGPVPLAGVVALRWWMAMINEPSPGLIGHALDRIDGAVEQKAKIDGTGTQTIEVVYVNHQDRARGDT